MFVDSETACGGHGLVAMAAAAAAARGARRRRRAAARAGALRADLKIWFAVDTLEFLRRGGRIGAAQALLGSALKIKPILTLEQEIKPVERVRTAGRAVERLMSTCASASRTAATSSRSSTSRTPSAPSASPSAGREIFGRDPLFVSEIGPGHRHARRARACWASPACGPRCSTPR